MLAHDGFDLLLAQGLGEIDGEAGLAVEGNRVGATVLNGESFIVLRPLCKGDGVLVAGCVPEFLGDVRSKRAEQDDERLENLPLGTFEFGEFIQGYHKCCNGCVVGEGLYVCCHLAYKFVQGLEFRRTGLFIIEYQAVTVEEQPPHLLEEAVHTVDSLGVPRLALLQRAQEHFVEAESVGSVGVAYIVRIHHVEHRLAHLLHCTAADVFPVLKYELRVSIFRHPFFESLRVETVVVHQAYVRVDFCGLVLVFQSEGNEGVGAYDAVHEAGATLDHTLVDKLAERLLLADIAQVVEELVPETGVDEVAGGVLCTSYVKVHVAPVFIRFPAHQGIMIVRVHITEIIGAAACKAGHCAGLNRAALIFPALCPCKRRLSALRRQESADFRQFQRQFVERNRNNPAILVTNRERLSPISLTGEDGIAQTVIDFPPSQSVLLHIVNGSRDGLLHSESVQETGIAHYAVLGIETFTAHVATLDKGYYRQIESLGKGIVTAVVCRNSHNCAGAVTREHIFGNPDRHLVPGERVDGIRAGEYSCHIPGLGNSLALSLLAHLAEIFLHLGLTVSRGQFLHPVAFRSQHEESHPENSVGTCGEDGNIIFLTTIHCLEHHFATLAASYPVALHIFQ